MATGTGRSKHGMPQSPTGPMQLIPAEDPKDIHYASVTTAVTDALPTDATYLRVVSDDQSLLFRWHTSADTTACDTTNFQAYCPAGVPMDFVVPKDKTAISMLADTGTAKVRLVWV